MAKPLRFLILSGPTREYLDPVRYLSNASSGRQGLALAQEVLRRGHEVELIQGPVDLPPPPGLHLFAVTSAREMLEQALARHPFCDVLIGAAAVSDFRPRSVSPGKLHREPGGLLLELEPTEDILGRLGRQKGLRVHAGFALETDSPLENGLRKLFEKNLDWLVVNGPDAIAASEARYVLLGPGGLKLELGRMTKEGLAARLTSLLEESALKLRVERP